MSIILDESVNWKSFVLSEIADIRSGNDIPVHKQINGSTPYVSATSHNNGVSAFLSNNNSSRSEGILAVNRNGSVGEVFYHPYEALFGNDTRRIILKQCKNKWTNLFLATAMRQQKSNYGYGYKLGTGRLIVQRVMLPSDESGKPNWTFMENYMKSRYIKKIRLSINHLEKELSKIGYIVDPGELTEDKIERRLITEVVDSLGSAVTSIDGIRLKTDGVNKYPYISRTANQNGVSALIPRQNMDPDKGNAVVIGLDTQTLSYQPSDFYCGQNIQVLRSKFFNRYSAMTFISLVYPQMEKFMWGGTGATLGRLRVMDISVPVNGQKGVDWEFLENLGKWRHVQMINKLLRKLNKELDNLETI